MNVEKLNELLFASLANCGLKPDGKCRADEKCFEKSMELPSAIPAHVIERSARTFVGVVATGLRRVASRVSSAVVECGVKADGTQVVSVRIHGDLV